MANQEAWIAEASQPIADALTYWRGKCQGDRLPSRQDIDPVAIKRLLPSVMLVDVIGAPPRFRYRLVGTAIVAFREGQTPRDPTGHDAEAIAHPFGTDIIMDQYRECVATRRPAYRSGRFAPDDRYTGTWQRLVLPLATPLATGDGPVDMLFAVFVRL